MSAAPLTILVYVEHFRPLGAGAENEGVALLQALAARGHRVHVLARTHAPCPGVTCHDWAADAPARLAEIRPDVTLDWGLLHPADVHRVGGGTHGAFQYLNAASYPPPLRWLKRLLLRPWVQALTLPVNRDARTSRQEHPLLTSPTGWYVCNSQATALMAIGDGAAPLRVRVIRGGVDTARFSPATCAAQRTAARARFGLPADALVGVFVAHNLRLKNLDLLRAIGPALHARFPQWRLLVVGKRAPRWSAPWLVYGGHQDDMVPAYAAADLLLHPTYYDSFGYVVLEAMSCGLPVVVSEHTGARELVASAENGLVLPVHLPRRIAAAQWTAALTALCADPATMARYGAAARATAAPLTLARFAADVEALLAEVAAARR